MKLSQTIPKVFAICALALPLAAAATPGLYTQLQGGLSDWRDEGASGVKFSKDSSAFRFAIGGLGGNACGWEYGIEAGATVYPHLKRGHLQATQDVPGEDEEFAAHLDGRVVVKGYSIDLLGALKYNFTPQFNAFTKVGAAYLSEKLTTHVANETNGAFDFSGTVNGHQWAPEAVLGVGYHLNRQVEATLAISEIFAGKIDKDNLPIAATGNILLGVTYHFA